MGPVRRGSASAVWTGAGGGARSARPVVGNGALALRGAGRAWAAASIAGEGTGAAGGSGTAGAETGAVTGADFGPPLTDATRVPQAGHDSRPLETRAPHDGQAIGFLGNSVPL